MKKKTSSILLLSAFAALVLAGCNTPTNSSSPAPSSESSESVASESKQDASSSETVSSVVAGTSSSTAKTWTELGVVGEYKGGMNSLIVNADQTTSWGTSNTKFPAILTELPGGVFHIVSASSVSEEDKVDVYTDGTMAHVVHDESSMDNFVMDKNAAGGSATAFAETDDETKFFGGVEISNGHWKYFANIDGTYHFGVTVTLERGNNISNGGAIFNVTIGSSTTSFRVTTEASSTGAFAKVEPFNLTVTTYSGDNGDLRIGKTADGELAFAKLEGTELVGAVLEGNVLSVPTEDSVTYDRNDPTGPKKVITSVTYTLATVARTYVVGTGVVKTDVFAKISGNTGSLTAVAGDDGNIWALYTPTADGSLAITETQKPLSSSGTGLDTHICVFPASATSYTGTRYTPKEAIKIVDAQGTGSNFETLSEAYLSAGQSYVIKIGNYNDSAKEFDYTGTASAATGQTIGFSWTYTPFSVVTYTGPLGNLEIQSLNNETACITLAGVKVDSFDINGVNITMVKTETDMSNPSDPSITKTTTVIVLNPADQTYTATATPVTTHPFVGLAETSTSFSHATDSTGNTWAAFTPSADGQITIVETSMGSITDTYLAVYDLTALNNAPSNLTDPYNNALGKSDANPAKIENLNVTQGHTYIIKHGGYKSRSVLIGETTTTTADIGTTISYSFQYNNFVSATYSGADGDLVISTKEGAYDHATLAGASVTGLLNEEGNFVIKGQLSYDLTTDPDNPVVTSTDTVYTLDGATNSYTKAAVASSESIVKKLTEASTTCSGITGEDGSIWASFTPVEDGYITIQETIQARMPDGSHDTLVSVYDRTASANWDDYVDYTSNTNGLKALNAESAYSSGADNSLNPVYVKLLPVVAARTYIIKIGAFWGNKVSIGNKIGSSYTGYVGSTEEFSFRFDKTVATTYAGSQGELVVTTLAGSLVSATVGGIAIDTSKTTYDEEAGTLSLRGNDTSYDLATDPLDPTMTRTDTVYTLDKDNGSYEVVTGANVTHLFHEMFPGETYTGTTGADGSYYAKFTAKNNGVIKVTDIALANSSDYVVIYHALPGTTAGQYKYTSASSSNNNTFLAYQYCTSANTSTSEVAVTRGETYIIKVCSSSTSYYGLGETAGASYQFKTGTIKLEFTAYDTRVVTGANGDLVIESLNGVVKNVTVNGEVITGAVVSEDGNTVTCPASSTLDTSSGDPVIKTNKTSYVITDGAYEAQQETSTIDVLQGTLTDEGTINGAIKDNGFAVIKFVAPADGDYTVSALVTGTDSKLGVFSDAALQNPVGTAVDAVSGSATAEQITFTATAGTTYFIKTSYWSAFSNPLTSIGSTYKGKSVSFTISAAAASGGSSSTSSSSSSSSSSEDDWYDDDYYDYE